MITIQQILKDNSIGYKLIDEEKNRKIYKIGNIKNLLILESKDDQFQLSREWFEYLDFNKLPYSILLLNQTKEKLYYLELSKEHNWVKSCFGSCDKESIYLGKQILNNIITVDEICIKLKKV